MIQFQAEVMYRRGFKGAKPKNVVLQAPEFLGYYYLVLTPKDLGGYSFWQSIPLVLLRGLLNGEISTHMAGYGSDYPHLMLNNKGPTNRVPKTLVIISRLIWRPARSISAFIRIKRATCQ